MKILFMLVIIAIVIAAATAIMTNPKEGEHRILVDQTIIDSFVAAAASKDKDVQSQGMQNLMKEMAREQLAGMSALFGPKYENKYLYSQMTVELNGLRIVTIGAFGKVSVTEKTIPNNFLEGSR
jgi:hypothetical protein